MIVAPGVAAQHVAREDQQQLVAPDDPALAVDRADPVAVAVEGDAEIEPLVGDQRLQVGEVGLGSVGSGWWLGKRPSTSV